MVCLDTHVIIWGIKEEATQGQEEMVQRAKSYIRHQDEQGVDLMVPAPVVAEAMIRGDVDQLRTIRTIIERSFFIAAFDSPAAFIAQNWSEVVVQLNYLKKEKPPRSHIRIDAQNCCDCHCPKCRRDYIPRSTLYVRSHKTEFQSLNYRIFPNRGI